MRILVFELLTTHSNVILAQIVTRDYFRMLGDFHKLRHVIFQDFSDPSSLYLESKTIYIT